jgi:hypothetical protein
MNHAKTSFSTEIFAGAIISVVPYLAPLRYAVDGVKEDALIECGSYFFLLFIGFLLALDCHKSLLLVLQLKF